MAKNEPQKIGDIISRRQIKKPPAYEWQDLALRIVKELNIPIFKKNSVFKICRDHRKEFVEKCVNETKELCQTGQKWKYFFKLANQSKKTAGPQNA